MNAKAGAWKTVELFMIRKFWKRRCDFPGLWCDFPGLWVLGTCLSSACYATLDRSLTEPLFKSFIGLIHCFSPFHLCEDLKTKVHFWLLGSWAHQGGSKDKAEILFSVLGFFQDRPSLQEWSKAWTKVHVLHGSLGSF